MVNVVQKKEKKVNIREFRISSKTWFLTYPKCPMSKEEVLEQLRIKVQRISAAVISRELHEDGEPHIHAYVQLAERFDCQNAKYWDLGPYHGNYQKARNIRAVVEYIKKDGDILQHGDIDWKEKVESTLERRRYLGQRLISGVPLKQVVEEEPSLLFGLKTLSQDLQTWRNLNISMLDKEAPRGVWITGRPGHGKSHYVRTLERSLFTKSQNKWWDGYSGEAAILMDDFDHMGTGLSHYLKIWADQYGCMGEIKGGTTPLCHERFYITSNYTIDQLWPPAEHSELNDAIHRRFKLYSMVDRVLTPITRNQYDCQDPAWPN